MKGEVISYFAGLFESDLSHSHGDTPDRSFLESLNIIDPKISKEDNLALTAPYSETDVTRAYFL